MSARALLALAIVAAPLPALAEAALTPPVATVAPKPDRRVLTLPYAADQVYELPGHYGFQIMVEFNPDERIENVAIGDSLAWQVTPNRRADTLFLKPIERGATTNLSVVTSKRRYAFVLTARDPMGPNDPDLVFRVRFAYPDAVSAAEGGPPLPEPEVRNSAYSISGSPRNVPARVFDDGARTYLEWPAGAATPAVFALGEDGAEMVVNFNMRGNLMVIERVGPAFVLRNGTERTLLFNDAWRVAAPGPEAPRVRDATRERSGLSRLFGRRDGGTPR